MSHYHVRVQRRGVRTSEVKLDVDETTLESQFLSPYREGRAITLNGVTVAAPDIERIKISHSDEPSERLIERLKSRDAGSSIVRVGGSSYQSRAERQRTT